MKKKKSAKGILIDVGILLVCLLVVSTCLASGIFAKFITAVRNNRQEARVAVFDVGASSTDSSFEIGYNETNHSFSVQITNNAETAVRYSLKLDFTEDVTGVITAVIGDTAGTLSADGKSIYWTDLGTMAKGAAPVSLPLTITINRATITSDNVDYDFNAVVTFTQID